MSKALRNLMVTIGLGLTTFVGCAADTGDEDDGSDEEATEAVDSEISSLRPGVNSKGCKRSAYNCSLNPGAGTQRVRRADGKETWGVETARLVARGYIDPATAKPAVPVHDGNGERMGFSSKTSFTLNFGQTRRMNDVTYVYGLSTGIGSAGWIPIDVFLHEGSLRDKVGEVNARGGDLKDMACYEVRTTFDKSLESYKVVKGAKENESMEPDDYLPTKRANGKIYMNLAFNVPGDALGGPSVDIFPAGTKFQRLDVPTWEGSAPSIDAKLWKRRAGTKTYDVDSGKTMKFLYGYVKSKTGSVRYGWMAADGLTPSKGCPNR